MPTTTAAGELWDAAIIGGGSAENMALVVEDFDLAEAEEQTI
ncbi:hypothetical protein GCM10028800_13810 [Nesterenkonia populi]